MRTTIDSFPSRWRSLCVLVLSLAAVLPTAMAADYYVDDTGGLDTNAGTSAGAAWQSLTKVTATTFAPGDKIYFKAGGVWTGRVELKGSGNAANPIVVDQYSTSSGSLLTGTNVTGNKPKIDGGGYQSAVQLVNNSYWELNNLEIVNDGGPTLGGASKLNRYGIYVLSNSAGIRTHFYFKNLYVHDVFPETTDPVNGVNPESNGIHIVTTGTNTDTYFDDVRVENCYISYLYRYGFWIGKKGARNPNYFYHKNILIRNNTFYQTGGSGVLTNVCDGVLLEHNVTNWTGYAGDRRMWNRGSGYWPYSCRNVTVQYNQFMHARGIADSCGMHTDLYNENVLVQYNFSYDNAGGFCEILEENNNVTYRYNVSVNDGDRINGGEPGGKMFFIQGGNTNVKIYNNTVYVKPGMATTLVLNGVNPGQSIWNNIFVIEGELINTETAGTNPGNFNGNIWYGNYPGGLPVSDTDVFVNPLLVNPGGITADDYKLQDTSPAIGAGVAIADAAIGTLGTANTHDYWGTALPATMRSFGAYEVDHNFPPVPTPQSVSVVMNTARTITLAAVDANGDALTYAVVTGPSHGSLTGTAPDLIYTPAAGYSGADSFTFRATDSAGAVSASVATVGLTVGNNQLPVARAGVDQSVDDADGDGLQEVTLDGSGSSDSDGTLTTYAWTEGATPIATGSTPTVSLATGVHTLTLTVTDNNGGTATDTVNVVVVPLVGPTITVAATDSAAAETVPNNGVFTLTRSAPTTSALDVLVAIGGTATNGVDYAALSPVVHFNAGSATATLTVVPVDDTEVDPAETVTVTTFAATPSTAKVTITDNDLPMVTLAVNDNSSNEAGSNTGIFLLTRNGSTAAALTVNYTLDGTAINGTDYTTLTGSATFAIGSSTVWLAVTPTDDAIYEGPEAMSLTLSAGSSYLLGATTSGTITISDNDLPTVSLASTNLAASEAGPVSGVLTLTRTGYLGTALDVALTIAGTATNGVDYITLPTTVSFAAGSDSAIVTITPIDNTVYGGPKTVMITLPTSTAYTVAGAPNNSGTVTIADDDLPGVTVAVTDSSCAEQFSGAGVFTLTRDGLTSAPLTVYYTLGGSAESGTDYAALTGSVTFAVSKTTATVTITPVDDAIYEGPEDVTLTLNADSAYTVGTTANASITITDSDLPTVSLAASATTLTEGGAGAVLTFTRTGITRLGALTIPYTVAGTAVNGSDYTGLSGSITIPQDQATATTTVAAILDSVSEAPETLIVTIPTNAAYTLGSPASATLTMSDNVATPVTINIAATDAATSEPSKGDGVGTFTLTRSGDPSIAVTVNVRTTGTATAGSDYSALPNTMAFAANQTTATVTVAPLDDNDAEPDETVILNVLAGTGYTVGTSATATVNLYDDESTQVVRVEVTDSKCIEQAAPDAGVFTLRRLGNRTAALTVNYTMSGRATNGTDYTALSGAATIAANSGSATVTVAPINDAVVEGTETVILTLGTGSGYTPGTPANGTIELRDDEVVDVTVTVLDGTCIEQPTPDNGSFRITSTAAAPTGGLTVSYTIGGTATAGFDYTTLSGTATIPAGALYVDVLVAPLDDTEIEGAESVIMTLSGAGAVYDIGDNRTQTLWIRDNEVPTITVTAPIANAAEGDGAGGTGGQYTFTASSAPSSDLTLSYTMAGTAMNGVDYNYLPGAIVLPAGQTAVSLVLTPMDDELAEVAETAVLTAVNAGLYNAGSTAVTVTIAASDAPVATIAAVDEAAAENPVDAARFVVALSKIVAANTAVNYTVGGTATSATDYTALTGSVTVAAGSNTATVTVTPLNDSLIEGSETVSTTLAANGALYTIGTPSVATVTIADDEVAKVAIAATDASAAEPVTGPATDIGTFTLTRDGVGTGTLTVNLAISGTATNGVDYLALPSTVTFAAAETSKTLMVLPYSDALVEGSETLVATVASGTGYVIDPAYPSATVTILDATLPPYDAWLAGFTFAPGADKTATGDPDGDGLANVIEYATGLNPTLASANPITSSTMVDNGSTYLRISVSRNPAVTNVLIEGLSAGTLTDPGAWSTVNTVIVTDTSSVFTVRDSLPMEGNSKRFLRLRFTLQP